MHPNESDSALTPGTCAMAVLLKAINGAVFEPEGRLPALRILACSAGVSATTMQAAIRELESAGKLKVIPRKGIFAADTWQNGSGPLPVRSKKWQRIRAAIEQDLLHGPLSNVKVLPQVKELQRQYGAHYCTIRKALRELEQDLVLRQERHLQIQRAPAHAALSHMLYVGAGDAAGQPIMSNERVRVAVSTFHFFCHEHQLTPACLGISPKKPAMGIDRIAAACNTDNTIGIVIWSHGLTIEIVAAVVEMAARKRIHCAVVDEITDDRLLRYFRRSKTVSFFRLASFRAGFDMGNYLLSLGHRRVAFVSIYGSFLWSQQRLQGLETAFLRAGFGDGAVKPILLDTDTSAGDAQPRISHEERELNSICESLQKFVGDWIEQGNGTTMRKHLSSESLRAVKNLRAFPGQSSILRLAIEKGLGSGYTAVAGANDFLGVQLREILQRDGIEEKNHAVSVLGFDDTVLAATVGLTSYNFNIPGIMRNAISRSMHARQGQEYCVEVPGILVQRLSVYRAG